MAARPPASLSYRTTGSTCLHPLSQLLGIPLDQVNFVACQLFALSAAFWFRIYLHPGKASPEVRHTLATILGIYFVVFCFGWYSCFVAMGYLTICHISRIYIFHYGILTTDFSGPLMIVTQKITTLAFQVHDGLGRKAEDLSAEQHRLAVKVKPSLLEYLSYHLNFMSVIAGPCNNFKDYVAFIEGRHVYMKLLEVNRKQRDFHSLPEPSPNLFGFGIYADAVHNAAGFGFSGMDEDGNSCWDLLSNLNIWKIETATSFKMYLENWNIQTSTWLKCVCYERVPWYPTVLTFFLSALWHGVYPGYYFTFLTGVPVTLAARAVRNNFRHHFLSSKARKVAYDVMTWAATQLAVSYTAAPFVMLAVEPTISLYNVHVLLLTHHLSADNPFPANQTTPVSKAVSEFKFGKEEGRLISTEKR
ncbi:Lysophospholipid acyltransferase 1 [Apodemus speciosus]|uniref:Lysophospholipid acyltransferase 1 n=1 Tax=Apodemus speciosus TaxID=105296 RepID=A0ABQ0FFM4_APOSI